MTAPRYSYTAITLHWLIALLLAFQIALGWALEGNNGPELFARYQLHKSIGITIMLLSLARLAVRLFRTRPPARSEEHTSELPSLIRTSYAAIGLKNKTQQTN